MSNKIFSTRLHAGLDEIGMSQRMDERTEDFAKFIHMPKFKAQAILEGHTIPDEDLLNFLADQFEVTVPWLLGKTDELK